MTDKNDVTFERSNIRSKNVEQLERVIAFCENTKALAAV